MKTLCVNTPIGVLTVEVTGNSFSTAGGISVYLQDSDANLYPLVATEFNSGIMHWKQPFFKIRSI